MDTQDKRPDVKEDPYAIAFFASQESSNITGSEIFVDGGVTQV